MTDMASTSDGLLEVVSPDWLSATKKALQMCVLHTLGNKSAVAFLQDFRFHQVGMCLHIALSLLGY